MVDRIKWHRVKVIDRASKRHELTDLLDKISNMDDLFDGPNLFPIYSSSGADIWHVFYATAEYDDGGKVEEEVEEEEESQLTFEMADAES